jgi:hypothetical protein
MHFAKSTKSHFVQRAARIKPARARGNRRSWFRDQDILNTTEFDPTVVTDRPAA